MTLTAARPVRRLTQDDPCHRSRTLGRCAVAVLAFATGYVFAESAPAASPAADSLTLHGITAYGVIDLGVQYSTHGAPESDYFPAGTESIIQKNSNHAVLAVTPSNLSQSKLGLQGSEPLFDTWSGIFKLETFFNPQSGQLSDALKSLTLNNGRTVSQQQTGVDSSVAGQAFAGAAYAGVASAKFGSLTFGRQNGLIADGIAKYDPQGASQAYSLIGFSGTAAGGGATEDRRLDSSLKYVAKLGPFHVGAQYKFSGADGSANTAWQAQLGADQGKLSIDALYAITHDAVNAAALSPAQLSQLPALGLSAASSLSAVIADNKAYALMGLYLLHDVKLFAGYEYIECANPSSPLTAGTATIGGYILAFVNNTAYTNDKVARVAWTGAKTPLTSRLDLTAAYYGYFQNSYAAGALSGCSGAESGACRGRLNVYSLSADYRLARRFDGYAGAMRSDVSGGLSSGYLHTATLTTTVGLRFKF